MVLYSRKHWRELNLEVGSQIAIANILADLNLVVRNRHTYICDLEILVDFNLATAQADRQTDKFFGNTVYYGVFPATPVLQAIPLRRSNVAMVTYMYLIRHNTYTCTCAYNKHNYVER